jgi:hypothetical protein
MNDTATSEAAPAAGTDEAPDWRGGIEDPDLRRVAEKFASPGEVVKSYAALERRLGRSVVKPGPEAGPEEIARYRRQLGVPESAEDYDLRLPDDLPEALREDPAGEALRRDFLQAMHAAGASGEVVQSALDWYYASAAESLAAQERAAAERGAEAEAELRREWGGDHERNVALARRAAQSFGDEAFAEFLEAETAAGVRLGDHPAFLRAFAAVGRAMDEDQPLSGAGESAGSGLQARIDALHALQDSDPRRYASPAVQSELQSLYARLYGGQPVVGSEGRRL